MTRTCLDLFAGVGGFSSAFEESPEWDVVTVDIEPELDPDITADVMDLRPSDLPDADVVLASPPCTEFSTVQNLNGGCEPSADAVALVYHTMGICEGISPDCWFMENPRGRLRTIIGKPTGTVTYCAYGTDYQKPTDLWGDHPDGMAYRSCPRSGDCHINGRDGTNNMPSDYGERAKVPYELSESILRAVEGRSEQSTLTEIQA